ARRRRDREHELPDLPVLRRALARLRRGRRPRAGRPPGCAAAGRDPARRAAAPGGGRGPPARARGAGGSLGAGRAPRGPRASPRPAPAQRVRADRPPPQRPVAQSVSGHGPAGHRCSRPTPGRDRMTTRGRGGFGGITTGGIIVIIGIIVAIVWSLVLGIIIAL